MQESEVAVVDEFVLLAFAEGFDGESELLFGLVHRLVVEVGDAAVDAENRLGDAEFVFAGGTSRSRRRFR
ncbi:hypothetical protein GCM10027597_60620 [Saccharopolyspora tripterygii]